MPHAFESAYLSENFALLALTGCMLLGAALLVRALEKNRKRAGAIAWWALVAMVVGVLGMVITVPMPDQGSLRETTYNPPVHLSKCGTEAHCRDI
jgi:hypothetical protein